MAKPTSDISPSVAELRRMTDVKRVQKTNQYTLLNKGFPLAKDQKGTADFLGLAKQPAGCTVRCPRGPKFVNGGIFCYCPTDGSC